MPDSETLLLVVGELPPGNSHRNKNPPTGRSDAYLTLMSVNDLAADEQAKTEVGPMAVQVAAPRFERLKEV